MSHSDPSDLGPRNGKDGYAQTELAAVVGDIAVAVREELVHFVPHLLTPIFDEFHELKKNQDELIHSILSSFLYKPMLKEPSAEFYASRGHDDDRELKLVEYLRRTSPPQTDMKIAAEDNNTLPAAAIGSSSVEGLRSISAWTELEDDLVNAPDGTAPGTSPHAEDMQSTSLETRQIGSAECVTPRALSSKPDGEGSKVSSAENVTPVTLGTNVDGEGSKSTGTKADSIESMLASAVGSSQDREASQSTLLQPDSVDHASASSERRPSVAVQTELEEDCFVETVAAAGDAGSTSPECYSPRVLRIDVAGRQATRENADELHNIPNPPQALHVRAVLPNASTTESQRTFSRNTGYAQLLEHQDDEDEEASEAVEMRDPEGAKRLSEEIASLEKEEALVREYLNDLERLFTKRSAPYKEDMAKLHAEIEEKHEYLEEARMPKVFEPPPPGPVCLKFVHTDWFGALCNVLVLANLISMAVQPQLKIYASFFRILDNIFLTWYVFELGSKTIYYQKDFMIGKVSVVWWNWLDTGIVIGGVLDQWLMPVLTSSGGGHKSINTSTLRCLRLLRLFRLLRFLRIVKAFLKSDLGWTNGPEFEIFMAGIIAFNSVVMSLELDLPWAGWNYVENFLLIVYSFELSLRLKHSGWYFFVDCSNIVWHYLDFIMVVGGILDQWLVPLVYALQSMFGGQVHHHSGKIGNALRLLKIMRILRVLRLVKLLQMIKPLYTLLMGVMESVRAMQWVMILTLLTLYACAIVFTNLVGRGLMHGGDVSDDEAQFFGSVSKSLFSLFKLMNGDTSVVEPITDSAVGQLLFVGFMVVSNWSILAILTSVVSDNMISSSQRHNEEEEEKERELDNEAKIQRLKMLFKEIDKNGNSRISSGEWKRMMEDDAYKYEICDATGLSTDDLNDYFDCLAEDANAVVQKQREKEMDYKTFMNMLKHEGTAADKRSILRVMSQLRSLENRVHEIQLGSLENRVHEIHEIGPRRCSVP